MMGRIKKDRLSLANHPMRLHGLSLVEVLVSLVILGLVTAVTVPLLINTMQSNADNRERAQAVAASEVWLDRFRSKSLDFSTFAGGLDYPFEYDFGADPIFVAAGDPDPAALNSEWGPFSFTVSTETFATSPLIWRVDVETRYLRATGQEGVLNVSTLVEQ